SFLPKMKMGQEILSDLSSLPIYDESICCQSEVERLMALSDLYNIYIPSPMSTEIYCKLYLALVRSLQKKTTNAATKQRNENSQALKRQPTTGIIGGSDSFTITGCSGIGKSSAINRAIDLIGKNGIIELKQPQTKIVPFVVVQCPFDSSVKGLLLEILRKVDEQIGSDYYAKGLRNRVTTDMLIGSVSQVALNHIGLLVVDEIQNVVNNKGGHSLVGMLTQLINCSGISICMVGTPESTPFFEQALQLARRSLGLHYNTLEYNQYFCDFCRTIFEYQYTKEKVEISDNIITWLYEHSGGIISVVISLLHDTQEIAILNGKEKICMETLNMAYQKRLSMLHTYIEPTIKKRKQTSTIKKQQTIYEISEQVADIENTINKIVEKSKAECLDIVQELKKHFPIVEVQI
ncbi:MAG: ATP-binding protein, partial [Clostridia bacterium]|nr:ATP-binding protein [Clostridia bacterium]